MNTRAPLVSVIVLNYNGLAYIRNCLDSVLNTKYPSLEVILVDNNSNDGSFEICKSLYGNCGFVKLVRNDANHGYALGNNIGATHCTGKYIVFLNSDTVVDEDWLGNAISVLEQRPRVGAAQCRIMSLTDRRVVQSAGNFLSCFGLSKIRGAGDLYTGQYPAVDAVFSAVGAAMIIRRSVAETIGCFDPVFYLTAEDGDLCWRVWLYGWEVVHLRDSIVYHKGQGAFGTTGSDLYLKYYRRNNTIMMLKNMSTKSLMKSLPVYLFLILLIGLVSKRKITYLKYMFRGYCWILENVRYVIAKRHVVQHGRVVGDEQLMRLGVLRPPSLEILSGGWY